MIQFKLLVLAVLFLCSCTATRPKINNLLAKPQKYIINNIELKEHQIYPIEYLLNNPDQKGLILDHYLGTGKTYTALAFALKNPDKKVLIIAPSFLKSNWLSHMDKLGIKDKKRFKFMSFDKIASSNLDMDLSTTILIVDEVHRLAEKINSKDQEIRDKYSRLYQKLQESYKILLLSGTPVFNSLSDIAFSVNLVAKQELLPFNERIFLDKYTKIEKGKSFWRGYVSESQILMFSMPFVLAAIPLAFITPTIPLVSAIYFGGIAAGFTILPITNALVPLAKHPLRSFSAEKLKDVGEKYVSFYDFRYNFDPNYPKTEIYERSVNYNEEQVEFFLDFADLSLNEENLSILARESVYKIRGNLKLESTPIQAKLRDWPDSGREIGNLSFINKNKERVEAPKFLEILDIIKKYREGIVIYSSYFENGSILMAEFLERHGFKGKYKILHPDFSVSEQTKIINDYNQRKLPILILHHIYTEGISLEQTKALILLEPLTSQALYEQIMGRTVRLGSHAKLPENERKVDIFTFKSVLSGFSARLAKNNNWAQRFSELNSLSAFGIGLSNIDPNFHRKTLSPDEFTDLKRSILKNAMDALKDLFRKHSIENHFAR